LENHTIHLFTFASNIMLFWSKLNVFCFVGLLSFGGIGLIILPRNSVSVIEKRVLCRFPTFSAENLYSGSYADSLDLYVADNFILREFFVNCAFNLKDNLGYKISKVVYYNKQTASTKKKDTTDTASPIKEDTVIGKSEVNSGIVIYKNRAFQLFTGVKSAEQKYATMINKYYEKFGNQAKVYNVLIPMVDEFYLPEEYKAFNPSELKSINSIHSKLNDSVIKVDVYSAINSHTSEYLFFNTDHHWTGRAAFYAYEAFCKSANISTLSLEVLERKVIPNFLGSLYWLTRDKDLRSNIDSVEYFKSPVKYEAFAYTDSVKGKAMKAKVYNEMARGNNAYGVFLGSDYGFFKVKTVNKTGRKAVIIKNSYGNPFSTYLLTDFDEINVVDYRYYKGDLEELIIKSGITHIIFVVPIMTANTKWHTKKMASLL